MTYLQLPLVQFILMFLIIVVPLAIFIVSQKQKVPPLKAVAYIIDWCIKEFNQKPVDVEPVPDIFLNENIISTLRPYNLLPPEQMYRFSDQNNVFTVLGYDVVMANFNNLQLIENLLKKVSGNYIKQYFPNVDVFVFSEPYGVHNACIMVCYAVYDNAKKALYNFINMRNSVQKQIVLQSVATVVDNDLENDLAQL